MLVLGGYVLISCFCRVSLSLFVFGMYCLDIIYLKTLGNPVLMERSKVSIGPKRTVLFPEGNETQGDQGPTGLSNEKSQQILGGVF